MCESPQGEMVIACIGMGENSLGESLCFHRPLHAFFLSSFQLVSGLYASLSLLCHPSANLIPLPPSPSVHPSLCSSYSPSLHPSLSFFHLHTLLLMKADFSVLGLTGVSFSRQPVTPPAPAPSTRSNGSS